MCTYTRALDLGGWVKADVIQMNVAAFSDIKSFSRLTSIKDQTKRKELYIETISHNNTADVKLPAIEFCLKGTAHVHHMLESATRHVDGGK